MHKTTLAALAATLAFAGCATTPIPAEQAKVATQVSALQTPPAGAYGTLIVTRDESVMGAGCTAVLSIDKQEIGRLATGETARFYRAPGTFILASVSAPALCTGGLRERLVEVKAGQETRYRISIDTGGMDLSPTAY